MPRNGPSDGERDTSPSHGHSVHGGGGPYLPWQLLFLHEDPSHVQRPPATGHAPTVRCCVQSTPSLSIPKATNSALAGSVNVVDAPGASCFLKLPIGCTNEVPGAPVVKRGAHCVLSHPGVTASSPGRPPWYVRTQLCGHA